MWEREFIERYFQNQVLPVLSPQLMGSSRPFPHLENQSLNIVVMLKDGEGQRVGVIPVPAFLPRVVELPREGELESLRYVLMEEVILSYAQQVLEPYQVIDKSIIMVTQNEEISTEAVGVDDAEDVDRHMMERMLKRRSWLMPVRLTVQESIGEELLNDLCDRLGLRQNQVFLDGCPLDLSYVNGLARRLPKREAAQLLYPVQEPQQPAALDERCSVMEQVQERDVLLHYPYEQMDPFLKLIQEASEDRDVLSIQIAIDRLAGKESLGKHLLAAAENNKDVLVLLELGARVAGQNNIDWPRALEELGCTVLHGFDHFKMHSELCLVTRRGRGNEVEYITQVGTGNYNGETACCCTDLCLMTADQEIGRDVSDFFKNMERGNLCGSYQRLLASPLSLKTALLERMDREIAKAREGEEARIILKVNSLTERELIDKLAEASKEGVPVRLLVEGVCCLLPDVERKTERVTVRSFLGRYLERSRVYCFGVGEDVEVYLSSADLTTRHMQQRVEIACPVLDVSLKQRILNMLEVMLSDRVKARELTADGTYREVEGTGTTQGGACSAQDFFMEEAKRAPAETECGAVAWIKRFPKRFGGERKDK